MWRKFTCPTCKEPLYDRESTCPDCDDILPDKDEAGITLERDEPSLTERITTYLNRYLQS